MPSCERCWADSASRRMFDEGVDAYRLLMQEREARGEHCTPEQQAGPDADVCPTCGRKTMHQHVRDVCMAGCADGHEVAPKATEAERALDHFLSGASMDDFEG